MLKCGGIVVGCTFDHRIADAYSANLFLVAWAQMAHSKTPSLSLLPSFRRSLLNPRRPGFSDPSLDDMYVPISALPPPASPDAGTDTNTDHLVSRIYYVAAEQISGLQARAAGDSERTKIESFTAFLWKMVAESAASLEETAMCKVGVVVDGRTRLANGTDDSMAMYFGNVLSIPYGTESVAELKRTPLREVAAAVHGFLEGAVTKEHFLGLIDWVEARRPELAVAKIYATGSEDGPAFVVSSGRRFPVPEMDFGWGRPAFGSYIFPWGGETGYVMPMPSPAADGDWVVFVHLFERQIEFIEARAADIFQPLTPEYLKLDD